MIRALLLDRDDTISISDPTVYVEAARWLVQRYQQDPEEVLRVMQRHWADHFGTWWDLRTLEDERAFWQHYSEGLAERLGLDPQAGEELMARYPYTAFLKPVPGLRDLLISLRARGLKIGILSNTLPNIMPSLEALGIADLVDTALSSCALGVHKPAPEVFVLAAAQLGLPHQDILFIDDKQENVDAARSVGMVAHRINLHQREEGTLHEIGEVLDYLDIQPPTSAHVH